MPDRKIPQGTFVVLAIVALGLIAMAGYSVWGVVQIAMREGPDGQQGIVNGSLGIISVKLIEMVLGWGDRVFKWTRGIDEDETADA